MRFLILIFLWFSLIAQTEAQNFLNKWYKGNVHTHSYWSDGDDFPEMIMEWYKSNGYHFVSLSDHNILGEGDKWKEIPDNPLHRQRFGEYLKKYGDQWVVYQSDTTGHISVKLKTSEEYRPLFEKKGEFIIMQAEEITDEYHDKPVHLGAVNVKGLIHPRGGNSVTEVMQNNLDAVYAQRKRTGKPMFPHINHPNFGRAIKLDDMMPLEGNRFFEIYNGHPSVFNYGDSITMGTEELWDKLQIHYLREGKPLVYGLATDEFP